MCKVQTQKCLNGLKQATCAWFAVSALVFSAWGSIKVFMIQHSSPYMPMQAFFYYYYYMLMILLSLTNGSTEFMFVVMMMMVMILQAFIILRTFCINISKWNILVILRIFWELKWLIHWKDISFIRPSIVMMWSRKPAWKIQSWLLLQLILI